MRLSPHITLSRAALTMWISALILVPGLASALSMGQLTGEVWGSGNRNLVVILHGDGGPGRYDSYADTLAQSTRDTTVVTLNRPAYQYNGQSSPGQNPSKDHYTETNNALIAQSLAAMKASLGTRNLIVMGHSGGAAHTGIIIGAYPGIIDVAILTACPCNVPLWRMHRSGKNTWKQSQSPHDFANRLPHSTKTYALTNMNDENTLPLFAQQYVGIAKTSGADIELITPEGGNHKWTAYKVNVDKLIRKHLR
ncbi:hypothetical protein GCM10007385_37360 [Tateyamaria omphalii]|nr:hypothetical protein GCM10007385_37360 [Tateyamaria omphalii]